MQTDSAARVVLITGASSGIGYATALAFARRGIHVVGTARRADRLQALGAEIAALPAPHGEFLPVAADVRDATSMKAAVFAALENFDRLDILIANAGVGQRGSITDSEWDDLAVLLRTNIDGVLHSIRAAVPALRESGGGHIVVVSSVTYAMVSPYAAVYAASKAFVSSMARSLRLELEADHIHVSEMVIGRTESEFAQKRLGASGYAEQAKASRIPRMSAEQVAAGIVDAVEQERKTVILRPFDRLLLLASRLAPGWVGRRAMKQYK